MCQAPHITRLKFLSLAGLSLIAVLLFSFQQTDGWLGTWTGEQKEGVTYTLTVGRKDKGMHLCEVHAEGIQTFYTLKCQATGTPSELKVYFRSATDGAFYAEKRVKPNVPLFILTRLSGKVTWQWQQIFDDKVVMRKI